MIQFDEEKQSKRIDELRKQEAEEYARYLAEENNLEYTDLSLVAINNDALRILTETECRDANIVAFAVNNKTIKVAVLSPFSEKTKAIVESLKTKGYTPLIHVVSKESLEKAWANYKDLSFSTVTKGGSLDIANEDIVTFIRSVKTIDDVKKLVGGVLAEKKSVRVSQVLEIMLAGALATNASDIHIEPEENDVRLRYRLDGVLTDILVFDRETHKLITSRIKLLSGLKLNVSAAQDGRFSVVVEDTSIEIRTSTLPGAYSESIVMRLLNPKSIQVPMEELGFDPRLLTTIQHEIAKPNGMILTTGPTGSGKTTTLYAFLRRIHTPDIKIITIENPIEYHLPGIVQTQVTAEHPTTGQSAKNSDSNSNEYTFAAGLRAALRQDPDVIMVGEIRDNETAETAVNSALTGHLVFSTLHTNNAAGTFPRLIDLGVNPKIISSAINIALAQRLVRKLCTKCKHEIPVEGKNKEIVEGVLSHIVNKEYVPQKITLWEAPGCPECNGLGYKGRIGVHEAILVDDTVEQMLMGSPSEREIKKATRSQGLLDMREDGVLKAINGTTSLDELGRVVDLEEKYL